MKAIIVSLLTACVLVSCQDEQQTNVEETIKLQKRNPGNGWADTNNGVDEPTDAPIDGGLGVLLIAGAAYGVKKMANAKTKNKTSKVS